MRKIIVLLMALLLTVTGCSKNGDDDVVETTPTPTPTEEVEVTPTPEVTEDTTGDEDNNEDDGEANLGEDTEVIDKPVINADSLQATFVEDAKVNPTMLTFYLDGNFDANLNVCSAMEPLSGKYELDNNVLKLWFEDETGYSFLDGVTFVFDLTSDRLALQSNDDMFSCAGSDVFKLK